MEAAEKQLDTIGHIAFGMMALSFLIAMESLWGPVHLTPLEAAAMFWGLNGGALLLCLVSLWYFHTPKPRPVSPHYPGRVTITPVYEEEEENTTPLLPPGYDSFNDDPTEWL